VDLVLSLLPVLVSVHSILQYPDFSNPCNTEFDMDWRQNKEICMGRSKEICYLCASSKPAGWD
jgi:ubiquitin-protein ligase